MPYLSKEQIAAAREMDLLTYLRRFEPEELVHIGGTHQLSAVAGMQLDVVDHGTNGDVGDGQSVAGQDIGVGTAIAVFYRQIM